MAKSTAKYTLIPTADEDEALLSPNSRPDSDESDSETAADSSPGEQSESFPPDVDPRFIQPTPSPWKRAGLLLFIIFLFWLAFQFKGYHDKPKVIHASRYSKEFKYRPAASPIITETLKDGRLRVRGAAPTTSALPTPTPMIKPKSKKKGTKKRSGKGKKAKKAKTKAA
ncbi:hypothetical protein B0H11DRAFT_1955584 [Mycena galericulata]|nr:hypothetical protein B0H11DRAFT_1955584 [Mycena galericulata]